MGSRVVASRSIAMRQVENGVRTDRWRLPKRVKAGTYRMVVHVTVIAGGRDPGTVTKDRSVTVRAPP